MYPEFQNPMTDHLSIVGPTGHNVVLRRLPGFIIRIATVQQWLAPGHLVIRKPTTWWIPNPTFAHCASDVTRICTSGRRRDAPVRRNSQDIVLPTHGERVYHFGVARREPAVEAR